MDSYETVMAHVEAIRVAVAADMQALEQGKQQLQEQRAALDEERRLFEVEKRALRDRLQRGTGLVAPIKGEVVELNVGGTHFTTSLTTLLADPNSVLAKMFSQPSTIPLDPEGRFFLDFAGAPFDYVLKYLRGERFFVRKHDPIVAEVYSLAHRLGLSGFIKTLEVVLRGMKEAKAEAAPAVSAASPPAPPQGTHSTKPRQLSPPADALGRHPGVSAPSESPGGLPVRPDSGSVFDRDVAFSATPQPQQQPQPQHLYAPPQAQPAPVAPTVPVPHDTATPALPDAYSAAETAVPPQVATQPPSPVRSPPHYETGDGSGELSTTHAYGQSRPYDIGTPDVQRVDPALHDPLRRALERQRFKHAKQIGVEQLDRVRLEEAGQRAEDSWEQHWSGIVSDTSIRASHAAHAGLRPGVALG